MNDAQGASDPGDLLRQISGELPMEEPLPDALPAEAAPPAPAEAPAVPGRSMPPSSWWERHRHELAGLVTAAVAFVWISLGLAARAWAPSLLGVTFAVGALLIGSQAVWTGD
jgi:hypothetical protein